MTWKMGVVPDPVLCDYCHAGFGYWYDEDSDFYACSDACRQGRDQAVAEAAEERRHT